MVLKEFRICMPMTVQEYQRGQLYMISRHSDEQSENGEGVEVVKNEPCCDDEYGNGQYTEKKIHLNKRLPSWAISFFPTIAVTEKAWNFYPYTITEYQCPWIPRLQIFIETRYEDNNGFNDHCPKCKMQSRVSQNEFAQRDVAHIDIAFDKVPEKHYKEAEDCTKFKSGKTGRGPLRKDWRETETPIMCSYKLVHVKFEVWGMQTKVENYILKIVRDILLLGHRQAFAWIDTWYDMTFESIRDYENEIQSSTNKKVLSVHQHGLPKATASDKNLTHLNTGGTTMPSHNSSTF